MILQGLHIDMKALDEVFDREFEVRETVAHERLRTIKEHDILATRRGNECSCEQLGLRPGMTVDALMRMGAGCCGTNINPGRGWVCPRLSKLRRIYGH